MKRIVVLGGGESGYGSAILAKVLGEDVFLSDMGQLAPKYREQLDLWQIPYEQGGHTEAEILNATEVIKSPGIPEKAPIVKKLREKNIPIISEIEFAGRHNDAKTICITGSNGKTTTTTLTYEILRQAGVRVALGGNIGESFAYSVAQQLLRKGIGKYAPEGLQAPKPIDWYVLELSSFQLDGVYDFRADIAILMNITPDHLDRYEYCMQNYVDSKMRVIRHQQAEQTFIYCADDKVITAEFNKYPMPMQMLGFSAHHATGANGQIEHDSISVNTPSGKLTVKLSELQLKGIHNSYNIMAASMAALKVGVSPESIVGTLKKFTGVEHRLEPVCVIDGVSYINDSKATNVDSVWYALESMKTPVVWIAGGTDKGNDYQALIDFARSKVKVLICMGLDNAKLLKSFKDVIPVIYDTDNLADAISKARESATKGDTVLLSPACASFDLFKNYEDRGEKFKQAVLELKK